MLTFSENVLVNWPAEKSHPPYGECDFDSQGTDQSCCETIETQCRAGNTMCGRFSLKADLEDIQSRFELFQDDLAHSPSYNIAPTQPVLAVTSGDGRMASHLRWGLIPPWSKNAEVGNRLINARAETVAERPSFRTALARRRCSSWPTGSNCRGPAYFHPLRPIGVVPGPGVVSNMRTCLPAAGNGPTGLWRGHPGAGRGLVF